jgi:hypothetical protein
VSPQDKSKYKKESTRNSSKQETKVARDRRYAFWVCADRKDEAMTREREQWTKYIEQCERQKKAPRAKRPREAGPSAAELEEALDDLVQEAEQRRLA